MALLKNYTNPSTQVTADYWDLTKIINNVLTNQTHCTLSLYVSQAAKESGAASILDTDFVFDGALNAAECFSAIQQADQNLSDATIV